jgi:hypothetical protein
MREQTVAGTEIDDPAAAESTSRAPGDFPRFV